MKSVFTTILGIFITLSAFSQTEPATQPPVLSGFIGAAVPLFSADKDGTSGNFKSATTLAFPIGFNLNKSSKFSYSIEMDPVISVGKNSSSVSNLVVLPGVLLHRQKITYGIRAAFETSGRYGMSFSLLKSIAETEHMSLVLGLPLDVRTGNGVPNGFGTGLLLVVVM